MNRFIAFLYTFWLYIDRCSILCAMLHDSLTSSSSDDQSARGQRNRPFHPPQPAKAPSQVPLFPQLTPPTLPLSVIPTTNRHNDLQRASVRISNSLRSESGEPTCPAGERRTSLTPSLGAQVQSTNPRGYHADAGSHP